MEIVLALSYPIDLSSEIEIAWLFTLCLQSGERFSVLVFASVSGKCHLSLEPVVPGDKQLCKGQRGNLVSLVIFLVLMGGLWILWQEGRKRMVSLVSSLTGKKNHLAFSVILYLII